MLEEIESDAAPSGTATHRTDPGDQEGQAGQRARGKGGRFIRTREGLDEKRVKRLERYDRRCKSGQFAQIPAAAHFPVSEMPDHIFRTWMAVQQQLNRKTKGMQVSAGTINVMTGKCERVLLDHLDWLEKHFFLRKVNLGGRKAPVYRYGLRMLQRMGDQKGIDKLFNARPAVQTADVQKRESDQPSAESEDGDEEDEDTDAVRPAVQTADVQKREPAPVENGSTCGDRAARPVGGHAASPAVNHRRRTEEGYIRGLQSNSKPAPEEEPDAPTESSSDSPHAEPPPTPENTPLDNVGNPPAAPELEPDRPDPRPTKACPPGRGEEPDPRSPSSEPTKVSMVLPFKPKTHQGAHFTRDEILESLQKKHDHKGLSSFLTDGDREIILGLIPNKPGKDLEVVFTAYNQVLARQAPLRDIIPFLRKSAPAPDPGTAPPEPPAAIAGELGEDGAQEVPQDPKPEPAAVVEPDGRGELGETSAPAPLEPRPTARTGMSPQDAEAHISVGYQLEAPPHHREIPASLRRRLGHLLGAGYRGELDAIVQELLGAGLPLGYLADRITHLEREMKGENRNG